MRSLYLACCIILGIALLPISGGFYTLVRIFNKQKDIPVVQIKLPGKNEIEANNIEFGLGIQTTQPEFFTVDWGNREITEHFTVKGKIDFQAYAYVENSSLIPGRIISVKCNNINSIDVINKDLVYLNTSEIPTLTELIYSGNSFTENLDVSNNMELTYLACNSCGIGTLDLSNNMKLAHIDCSNNNLTTFEILRNPVLIYLDCNNNHLVSLNLSANKDLTNLDCSDNDINTLSLINNISLKHLECDCNDLSSLDISQNKQLTYLDCRYNNIQELNLADNLKLEYLDCKKNKLYTLDLSKNIDLEYLDCSENHLTSIKIPDKGKLIELHCENNNLNASALNKIYQSLPQGQKWIEYGCKSQSTIYVKGCPGYEDSDKDIARKKGWLVEN